MKPRIQEVIFDSAQVPATLKFWASLLDARAMIDEHGWGWVEGDPLLLGFKPVLPQEIPPVDFGSRVHLDIEVDSLEKAASDAVGLGATIKRGPFVDDCQSGYIVMMDPEGNTFCFVTDPQGTWIGSKVFG